MFHESLFFLSLSFVSLQAFVVLICILDDLKHKHSQEWDFSFFFPPPLFTGSTGVTFLMDVHVFFL